LFDVPPVLAVPPVLPVPPVSPPPLPVDELHAVLSAKLSAMNDAARTTADADPR